MTGANQRLWWAKCHQALGNGTGWEFLPAWDFIPCWMEWRWPRRSNQIFMGNRGGRCGVWVSFSPSCCTNHWMLSPSLR